MTTESVLVNAKGAAAFCNRSVATWWRLNAAEKIPAPTKLGGATFWHRRELSDWIDAGCPVRKVWATARVLTAGAAKAQGGGA